MICDNCGTEMVRSIVVEESRYIDTYICCVCESVERVHTERIGPRIRGVHYQ